MKETSHPIKDILNDAVLFKSYLNKVAIQTRKKVMGVEIYLEKKKVSKNIKITDVVAQELYFALHKPHSSLQPNHQDLISKLLTNIAPKDLLYLYWYDKEDFYKKYATFENSLQEWVIETISGNLGN